VIYNEEPIKNYMWLDRKFRRNFRNIADEKKDDIEELLAGV